MDLRNKTFKDNRTGEIIRIIDTFENIAILESKEKVDVRRLMNSDFYTEQIDPNNFFSNQSAYNILAEKIKNIPTSQIVDDEGEQQINISVPSNNDLMPSTNESAIVVSSEDDERAELARKYGMNLNSSESVSKQNQAFAKLLGEDVAEMPQIPVDNNPIQRIEIDRNEDGTRGISLPKQKINMEDPIITMFKNVKRNKEFSISLEIKNMIPRPDFIEMMEDSYNTSIIDFLAKEFTNNLISNPNIIEDMIKDKIKEIVYTKGSINDQITDSVTQVREEPVLSKELTKKTTSRKAKPNASQVEKSGHSKPTKTKKETSKND